jgi:hypothetical protein
VVYDLVKNPVAVGGLPEKSSGQVVTNNKAETYSSMQTAFIICNELAIQIHHWLLHKALLNMRGSIL